MIKLKKFAALSLVLALGIAGAAGCGGQAKESKELNVFTWEEYIPSEVVSEFEAATGIKVNYSTFGTNDEMYSRLQAQKGTYDIVVCSDYIIDIMNKDGNLSELDKTKIPNFANIDPAYQNKYYDPDNKYVIPYATATGIIAYDKSKVDFEITGYADLWNTAFKDKVVLIDGDRDIIGLTLQMLGYSVNETDPARLEEAGAKLLELKPNIIKFDSDTPHTMLISGDAVIGYMFGSQATAAMEAVPSIGICYPKEGITFSIDNVVVPKDAPNYDNAMTFINYILDGKTSAKISSIINYSNLNTAAKPFLPESYLANPTFNIPADLLTKAEMFVNLGEASTLYDEIWTKFKSK